MMEPMQVHEAELITLLASSLGEDLLDLDEIVKRYGADTRSIDLKEAWQVLRQPHGFAGWSVVPTREGRLVLIRSRVLSSSLLKLSQGWSDRALGVLAALYEPDASHSSE
ncbi:hypothetical protein [Deinococcus navajonensis]|uniref:Uncharacterized protein n=1 Tax=Deinococcus navajonensis TaxID=309884 RepID=A0ABV8XQX4_9DEIO